MGKVLALLLIILLALASVAGYLFLTEKITAGERQIADGQRQLEKGQFAIEEGKTKLEAGKRELSEGKKEYEQAKDNPFFVTMKSQKHIKNRFPRSKKSMETMQSNY
jgi:hypothetical protein